MTDAPEKIQRFTYEDRGYAGGGQLKRDPNGDLMRYADLPATDAPSHDSQGIPTIGTRIKYLEVENKQLREVLRFITDCFELGCVQSGKTMAIQNARAALEDKE